MLDNRGADRTEVFGVCAVAGGRHGMPPMSTVHAATEGTRRERLANGRPAGKQPRVGKADGVTGRRLEVGRGQRINRKSWPCSGAHRDLLEFLDRVHIDNGLKSLAEIATAMHQSKTRVSDLLRATRRTMPADDRQFEQLVRALGGGTDEAARGMRLFRAAAAEARLAPPRPCRWPAAARCSASPASRSAADGGARSDRG